MPCWKAGRRRWFQNHCPAICLHDKVQSRFRIILFSMLGPTQGKFIIIAALFSVYRALCKNTAVIDIS